MTTETIASPDLQARVLDALSQCTDARQEHFASHVADLRAGTITQVRAWGILRQVRSFEAPAMGEEKVKMPRSNGTATTSRSNDASEAQARFATDLLRTRVLADERVIGTVKTAADVLAAYAETGVMSKAMARNVIDTYKDWPRTREAAAKVAPVAPRPAQAAPKPAPAELVPGIYQVGDDIYKVQKSRQSGRLYAQKLVDGRWDYDAGWGAMKLLRAEHLMTTEQARSFGQRFGMCVNGHPLSDRTSRYFGYGECCANKNGWTYDKALVPADFE
jgi:hypothetical protein